MAIAMHINDAGTWRKLKNIFIKDGEVWRQLKKVHVNDAGNWRQVFSAADQLTLTAGQVSFGSTITGYSQGLMGSVSPTSLGDGKPVLTLSDAVDGMLSNCQFTIQSFTDPGIGYLTSVTANGVTKLGAMASYNYAGSQAMWTWNEQTFGFLNGIVYPVEVVRT